MNHVMIKITFVSNKNALTTLGWKFLFLKINGTKIIYYIYYMFSIFMGKMEKNRMRSDKKFKQKRRKRDKEKTQVKKNCRIYRKIKKA